MIIQFNTDHNIEGTENFIATFTNLIAEELDRFAPHLTRIEAHLVDENADKPGPCDIRCTLEARVGGRQPIAATHHADTHYQAVSGATDKMKTELSKMFNKLREH